MKSLISQSLLGGILLSFTAAGAQAGAQNASPQAELEDTKVTKVVLTVSGTHTERAGMAVQIVPVPSATECLNVTGIAAVGKGLYVTGICQNEKGNVIDAYRCVSDSYYPNASTCKRIGWRPELDR